MMASGQVLRWELIRRGTMLRSNEVNGVRYFIPMRPGPYAPYLLWLYSNGLPTDAAQEWMDGFKKQRFLDLKNAQAACERHHATGQWEEA